ncbi:MAG: hypothetical protein ABIT71_05100, partial [Vicinamibacteraceae bacterium]
PATGRAAGEYRTIEVESLKITFDSEWANRTSPGYFPVRVDITNLGGARVIEIVGEGTRFLRSTRSMSTGSTEISQRVRLARGDRVRLTIPVPVFGVNENIRFEIRENGKTLERLNYTSLQSGSAASDAPALIVADRASARGAVMGTWLRSTAGAVGTGSYTVSGSGISAHPGALSVAPSRGYSSMPPTDFMLPPSRLPTNWLGYTSLRAVVIGPTEWEQLDEAQKNALLTWTACGGDLVFVDGDLKTLLPNASPAASPAEEGSARAYFFGRIHRPISAAITLSGLTAFLARAQTLQDGSFALPANTTGDWGKIAARGFRLPIPGVAGIPARAYVAILLLFSLIIGPANYWFLRRKGQQVLLVLTAPLIAAAFIVVLAGYVIAGEGFGVRGRVASFTMLDQARNQAVTRSSLSVYAAGMTPSGGWRVGRDVAVFPIGTEGTGTGERLDLDLSEAQRFSAGLIQARSPTNVEQIAFRPARERLTFTREGSGTTVVNGLGTTVTALVYRDGNTFGLLDERLPPGGKATLRTSGNGVANLVPKDLPLWPRFIHLAQHQPAGSYLAVIDRSPFVDPGVPDLAERGSFHFVLGWPGGQP